MRNSLPRTAGLDGKPKPDAKPAKSAATEPDDKPAAPAAKPKPAAAAPAAADPALLPECEIRVGKVVAVERHPESEKLYVEKVDVGEAEPRTILSGLAPFVPLEAMDGRDVVVLCNLKPRNMGGIKSFGMLLCASDKAAEVPVVEPLAPPAGAPVGERVCFGEWVGER